MSDFANNLERQMARVEEKTPSPARPLVSAIVDIRNACNHITQTIGPNTDELVNIRHELEDLAARLEDELEEMSR